MKEKINYKKLNIFLTFLLIFLSGLLFISHTKAYLTDNENVLGNTIQVGIWGTTITPTPTPEPTTIPTLPENTPTPTSTPTPTPLPVIGIGSVVINELMWMGSSTNTDDEWIELRNMTGNPIDLSNWQITSLVGTSNTETLMLTIPSGKTISANGYFLISHFNKDTSVINVEPDLVDTHVVLRNSDLQIKLYKGIWTNLANLIDTADDGSGSPLAGNNTTKKSMERNDSPGNGTNVSNWHTATTQNNLDSGATDLATPKSTNSPP